MKQREINEFPDHFDKDLKSLIFGLLDPNPKERLGYKDFSELLNHPYFRGCFTENGIINPKQVKRDPFELIDPLKTKDLKPIPFKYIFRTDDLTQVEEVNYYVKGFSFLDKSMSSAPSKESNPF